MGARVVAGIGAACVKVEIGDRGRGETACVKQSSVLFVASAAITGILLSLARVVESKHRRFLCGSSKTRAVGEESRPCFPIMLRFLLGELEDCLRHVVDVEQDRWGEA